MTAQKQHLALGILLADVRRNGRITDDLFSAYHLRLCRKGVICPNGKVDGRIIYKLTPHGERVLAELERGGP